MRICIYGGSFNPIHAGHVALARFAYSELSPDRFLFMPCAQNPLKSSRLLKTKERLEHITEAIAQYPWFEISRYELDQSGHTYAVDTLRHFREVFPPPAVLYFLAGADSLKDLARWKEVDEIFKLCRFVVGSRPGYELKTPYPVLRMPFGALPVSSTQIRSRR